MLLALRRACSPRGLAGRRWYVRDTELASPTPTAGTGGGGASCFHFWREALEAIPRIHIHTRLFQDT